MKSILEQANEIIANVEDDIEIARAIEERDKRDSGKRHTTEEVREKRRFKNDNKFK